MEIEIRILQSGDLEDLNQLLTVFDIVFEYESGQRADEMHLKRLLESQMFFAVVAKVENKVVAGLSAYVLDQYHSNSRILYIHDLAVLEEFQRKGIGSQLMKFINEYCRQQGFQQSFIQAEKVDDYAVEFYRTTKPTGELEAVHFYYNFDPETNE
jgi:aminoglycoside 3-N-acetyltransferase I